VNVTSAPDVDAVAVTVNGWFWAGSGDQEKSPHRGSVEFRHTGGAVVVSWGWTCSGAGAGGVLGPLAGGGGATVVTGAAVVSGAPVVGGPVVVVVWNRGEVVVVTGARLATSSR
jgi:hypothetical protein